jgi:outer membrane protein TolC
MKRLHTLTLAAGAALLLSGCASFSPDGGFGSVEKTAQARLGKDVVWARTQADQERIEQRVDALLKKPLSVDDAVQVALLNNRGLQASFAELGITEAEVVQVGRLPNPGPMEARRFQQKQNAVASSVLTLAADTRKAWVNAVAAGEAVRYARQVKQAADASAELAKRMEQVGNFNKLQRAREQSFSADAALGVAHAEQAQRGARERLTRLMGVWGAQTQFTLPERLPDLPAAPLDLPGVEQMAMAQRLDVQAAAMAAEQTAKNLGLTRTTRFINVLELGAMRNSSNEAPTQRGWEVSFELPLFDWGGARVAKAEAVYMQAVNRAAEAAVNARSEVREAYTGYRTAFDVARHHRDEIVPLRKQISDENLLRYNGMLIGVFELLADARSQIASVNSAIEALRMFWLAQADLDMALIGKPSMSAMSAPNMAAEPAAAAH